MRKCKPDGGNCKRIKTVHICHTDWNTDTTFKKQEVTLPVAQPQILLMDKKYVLKQVDVHKVC